MIDEPVLRMSIEKVLSGIEHVHAFTRAVSVGNPREFLQAMAQWLGGRMGALNLLGEYDFSEDKLQDSVGIKPPKLTD